jgi:5-methylcytosine-specific restriction endonuclease McrA
MRRGLIVQKFNEQSGICGICGEKMVLHLNGDFLKTATIDHIIPVSKLKKAGLKKSFMAEYNTQAVHQGCNNLKAAHPQSVAIGLIASK